MKVRHHHAFHDLALSTANASMRGLGLAGRFILSLYIAKYMGIENLGLFGLVAGIIGYAPAVLGCGLNYFLPREIIGMTPLKAGCLLRDRLVFSSMIVFAACLVGLFVMKGGFFYVPLPLSLLLAILVGEVFALDIHMALISLEKPFFANFLLFVRSASWVFPFAALGLIFPAYRQINILFYFWLGALFVNYAALFWHLRRWPWRSILRKPVDWGWISSRLKKAKMIYVSELGLAGLSYVDRFIINAFLDLRALGLYVFYWQMANAVQLLAESAVVQIALPRLVRAHRHEGEIAWRKAFLHETTKVLGFGILLSLGIYVFVELVLPFLKLSELHEGGILFPLILAGAVFRLLAGIANSGLMSRGLDNIWALTNIGGILMTAGLGIVGAKSGGITGVAIAVIISACAVSIAKYFFLVKDHRRLKSQPLLSRNDV